MGHPYQSWWTGSLLSIDEARAILPHQNATTLQVAGSIIAAVAWMIDNPNEGVCVPDDLPWSTCSNVATQVPRHAALGADRLGPGVAAATICSPASATSADGLDHDDPWQFTNFLVALTPRLTTAIAERGQTGTASMSRRTATLLLLM